MRLPLDGPRLLATGVVDQPRWGFHCTKVVIDGMGDRGWSRIVNIEQIPMGRFGKANEMARACMYLCWPDGVYITGAELTRRPA